MVLDAEHLQWMEERWEKRFNRPLPVTNRNQALVPAGATKLGNNHGSAPGIWLEDDRGRWVAMLPGVPREMRGMLADTLLPRLQSRVKSGHGRTLSHIAHGRCRRVVARRPDRVDGGRTTRGCDAGLSTVDRRMWIFARSKTRPKRRRIACCRRPRNGCAPASANRFTAKATTISLQSCSILSRARAHRRRRRELHRRLARHADHGDSRVERCSPRWRHRLRQRGEARIAWRRRRQLREHGAVSEEVAGHMATAVRGVAKANVGLAITGAGPSGEPPRSPSAPSGSPWTLRERSSRAYCACGATATRSGSVLPNGRSSCSASTSNDPSCCLSGSFGGHRRCTPHLAQRTFMDHGSTQ